MKKQIEGQMERQIGWMERHNDGEMDRERQKSVRERYRQSDSPMNR